MTETAVVQEQEAPATPEVTTNDDLGVKVETETETNTKAEAAKQQDLVFGKYKDITAAEEAFKNLESENGKLRRNKAPENYVVDFSNDEDFADYKDSVTAEALAENPYLKAVMPVAKEHNVSQEALNAMAKEFLKQDVSSLSNAKQEFISLGEDGGKMLTEVQEFIKKFPEEEQSHFAGLGLHPDGILPGFSAANLRLAKKLMDMSGEKPLPDSAEEKVTETSQQLKQKARELKSGNPNFDRDDNARKEYDDLMYRAAQLDLQKDK